MAFSRPRLRQIFAVVLATAGFVVAGNAAFDTIVDTLNRRQLDDLTRRMVERAERSVDYAFIALGELVEAGAVSCNEAGLAEIRRQVYRRGAIKDVRLVRNDTKEACSAFSEAFRFDPSSGERATLYPARNAGIQLFRLEEPDGAELGLRWEADPHLALTAVVSTDAMLFDMLPGELRDTSSIVLRLSGGADVATFHPSEDEETTATVLTRSSEQYPLTAELHVADATLAQWNKQSRTSVLLIAGFLGAIFGVLCARLITRPDDPVDEIDGALARREFQPYLQPIFSLGSGSIVGCEALVRWLRADGSVVAPAQFIPLAEASGRIVPMTWQVVTTALTGLHEVMRRDKSFKVSFNVVPDHFMAPDFAVTFKKCIVDARVSPRQVVIELTERQEIQDLDAAARVIADLRSFGLKVAIDDAGTGHSGLSYVQKLGVNTLKIDKFFVDAIRRDESARPVIEMLVRLARELHMSTVAEGIESEDQIELLRACGVDEGQGYLVSPPLPIPAFLALLDAQSNGGRAVPESERDVSVVAA